MNLKQEFSEKSWRDVVQWAMVLGIVTERYVECLLIIFLSVFLLLRERTFYLSKKSILFLITISFVSVVNICLVDYPLLKFIQQMFFISIFTISYGNLFHIVVNDTGELFRKYLRVMVWVAWGAVLQFVVWLITKYDIFSFIYGEESFREEAFRLHSIIDEPGFMVSLMLPAVSALVFSREIREYIGFLGGFAIFFAYVFSFATIGYFMLGLIFIVWLIRLLMSLSVKKLLFFTVLIAIIIGCFETLINDPDDKYNLKTKIVDTFENIFSDNPYDFESLNTSTYALLSNLWVANNAPSRIFGTGLGTHQYNYEFSEYLPTEKITSVIGKEELNSTDAYSIGVRVFSEFGWVGLVAIILWFIKFLYPRNIVNLGVAFYLVAMFLRGGHYFRYGFVFFIFLYIYSSIRKELLVQCES